MPLPATLPAKAESFIIKTPLQPVFQIRISRVNAKNEILKISYGHKGIKTFSVLPKTALLSCSFFNLLKLFIKNLSAGTTTYQRTL